MKKPTSKAALFRYLMVNPHLECVAHKVERFLGPVVVGRVQRNEVRIDRANLPPPANHSWLNFGAKDSIVLEFDETGFAATQFGNRIRFEYRDQPADVKAVSRPIVGDDCRRIDLYEPALAYARALGWTVIRPDNPAHVGEPTKFERANECVWVTRGGWMFARLIGDTPGGQRYADHRGHDSLFSALEDRGPGKGKFTIREREGDGEYVVPGAVGRDDARLILLCPLDGTVDWLECPVGTNRWCRDQPDGPVVVVTRVE